MDPWLASRYLNGLAEIERAIDFGFELPDAHLVTAKPSDDGAGCENHGKAAEQTYMKSDRINPQQ
jgi:hypothetical protein